MKTIFKLSYGCDAYYTKQYGDEYYCKSLTSTKRKLKELVKQDIINGELEKADGDEIFKSFNIWEFNKRTLWSSSNTLQTDAGEVFVMMQEIELI